MDLWRLVKKKLCYPRGSHPVDSVPELWMSSRDLGGLAASNASCGSVGISTVGLRRVLGWMAT